MDADPAPRPAPGPVRRFGPLLAVAALIVVAVAVGLPRHLSLRELGARREMLEAAVQAHPVASVAIYAALYTLLVACSIPAALVTTLAGGMLFGPWVGGLAAAVGCTAGATAVYQVCRTALGDALKRRAGPRLARLIQGFRRDAFSYVLMLRLIPVAPFWLANLAVSLIDIPLGVYVAATFLGILPVSLIYAGLGAELNRVFARGVRPDLHLLLRPNLLIPLAGLAVLAAAAMLARRWRK